MFQFVSDSEDLGFALCEFCGWGGVGDFYVCIKRYQFFLQALLVKVNAGDTSV